MPDHGVLAAEAGERLAQRLVRSEHADLARAAAINGASPS
jgi:hypothetical protein